MEDAEAIKQINEAGKNGSHIKPRATTSFIFNLKNKVGGLARALKVFEVNF
jgi:hypothetical protein